MPGGPAHQRQLRHAQRARQTKAPLRQAVAAFDPKLRVMSVGRSIEILKEVGLPQSIVDRFGVGKMTGTHVIGHTRMATESAVTTDGSHPFSTGLDLCLVHNGSLSNHNRLRQKLVRHGIEIRTQNDSEVAAGYLTWQLAEGKTLRQALESALASTLPSATARSGRSLPPIPSKIMRCMTASAGKGRGW